MIEALRRLAARPGAHLLPLRGFLGVTFTFAGLQKLANPAFFRASSPTSIQQQLADVRATSPVHQLVALAQHAPVAFGVAIALAELAAGLATLAGLLTRAAAGGGMLLSLTFFLTVSWTTSPYYYGADIVFVFAWLTIAIHGPTAPSLDLIIADQQAAARAGPPLAVGPAAAGAVDRRTAISRGLLAGCGAVVTLAVGGLTALVGHRGNGTARPATTGPTIGTAGGTPGSTSPTTTGSSGTTGAGTTGAGTTGAGATGAGTTTTAPGGSGGGGTPKGTKIGPAADVPVGGAASFTDPSNGMPAFAVQPESGTFAAFSAVCTHEGCTVGFEQSSDTFNCPCHGSIFDAKTGAVIQGPAPAALPSIPIAESSGQLYVNG